MKVSIVTQITYSIASEELEFDSKEEANQYAMKKQRGLNHVPSDVLIRNLIPEIHCGVVYHAQ